MTIPSARAIGGEPHGVRQNAAPAIQTSRGAIDFTADGIPEKRGRPYLTAGGEVAAAPAPRGMKIRFRPRVFARYIEASALFKSWSDVVP